MKKKSVVCVFAHPDDEAFGPSGTIYKLSQTYDVYILCATKGQAGQDSRSETSTSLTHERAKELQASARLLGVKKVYFLGFIDGTLSNNLYHKLATKIETHVKTLKPEIVMTFEPRGISGHIDHITVSMATQFVLRSTKGVKELWMHCLKKGREEARHDYFIYFPEGYSLDIINKTVDVSNVWDMKVKAMMCHKSQKHDADNILKAAVNFPKEEYFIVKKY